MDKRYKSISASEQLDLRREAIEAVLTHPEWSLPQAIRHMRRTMRLTTAEMAKLSGVSHRTLQDIEQERSEGSVQTINRIFGVLGLRLGVCRIIAPPLDGDS
jgi:DNA-binding XRE family transcriptional regulator